MSPKLFYFLFFSDAIGPNLALSPLVNDIEPTYLKIGLKEMKTMEIVIHSLWN